MLRSRPTWLPEAAAPGWCHLPSWSAMCCASLSKRPVRCSSPLLAARRAAALATTLRAAAAAPSALARIRFSRTSLSEDTCERSGRLSRLWDVMEMHRARRRNMQACIGSSVKQVSDLQLALSTHIIILSTYEHATTASHKHFHQPTNCTKNTCRPVSLAHICSHAVVGSEARLPATLAARRHLARMQTRSGGGSKAGASGPHPCHALHFERSTKTSRIRTTDDDATSYRLVRFARVGDRLPLEEGEGTGGDAKDGGQMLDERGDV